MVIDRDEQAKHFIRMCEYLARRFKRPDHFEDLRQEGLLAIYEMLAEKPATEDIQLFVAARKRMHDYLNIDCLPFTVPKSDVVRRLVRDADANLTNVQHTWTDLAVEHLRSVLKSEQVSGEDVGKSEPSSEELYVKLEFWRKLDELLDKELTSDEQTLLYMRYEEDMTDEEVAEFFGLKTHSAIVKREAKLIAKVRDIVATLQQ
jgi:RNA polymerase sigma factor (sigma-70 family)